MAALLGPGVGSYPHAHTHTHSTPHTPSTATPHRLAGLHAKVDRQLSLARRADVLLEAQAVSLAALPRALQAGLAAVQDAVMGQAEEVKKVREEGGRAPRGLTPTATNSANTPPHTHTHTHSHTHTPLPALCGPSMSFPHPYTPSQHTHARHSLLCGPSPRS